jgi:hypothetical protein
MENKIMQYTPQWSGHPQRMNNLGIRKQALYCSSKKLKPEFADFLFPVMRKIMINTGVLGFLWNPDAAQDGSLMTLCRRPSYRSTRIDGMRTYSSVFGPG